MAEAVCDSCCYIHESKKAIISEDDQNVFCGICKHVHDIDLQNFGVSICQNCGLCAYNVSNIKCRCDRV